ncbi:type II secretion system F family protein [Planctellipticum variicoloris]|uniref:type II secretion system F family protein n=1 Tax=Planctellipticum variicoloris TaxID=3064265 RepID=UPI003013A72B|nr:type II secretion system F family protein [Planctomycetaceae bacterium SH412]
MATFQYEAMDNTGLEIKESIEANSEQEATQKIREKGFYVTKIVEKGRAKEKDKKKTKGDAKTAADGRRKPKKRKKGGFSLGGVSGKKLCTFTRQLSTLQDAGLPILRSLRILEGQAKPGPLKTSLSNVIEDIESGSTLSEAMAKNPKAFDNLYVNMVKAGEAGGALEVILQRLAEFKERAQSLKRKVQGAMIYPCAVITVATLIVGFIMYYIIPKFKKIFEDFNTELPEITVVLIGTSDAVVNYWYLGPAIPFGLWLMVKIIKKNKTGAYICDWVALRIPLLGIIFRKAIVARTSRTLGTLIASGVPILEALAITRDTAGNAIFYKAYDHISAAIREGESMAIPLKETRTVDDMVVNMVDVGEETGALDTMLYKVADVYDEEVSILVEGLVNLLEPLMVVILGLIVGFIVIALFMPLIKLLNDLS